MLRTIRVGVIVGGLGMLAIGAGSADAQELERSRGGAEAGAVERVLRISQELELSETQVAGLRQIAEELRTRNEPLRAQLREMMGDRATRASPAGMTMRMRARGERTPHEREAMRQQTQARRDSSRATNPEERQARRGARQTRFRSMTAEERDAFRETMQARRDSLRSMPAEEREARRQQMQASRDSLRSWTAEEREARRDQMRAHRDPASPSRQLTDEQRAQFEAAREARRAEMERARPIMEEIRQNSRAAADRARAVLTEEQRARLDERRQQMRERRSPAGQRSR